MHLYEGGHFTREYMNGESRSIDRTYPSRNYLTIHQNFIFPHQTSLPSSFPHLQQQFQRVLHNLLKLLHPLASYCTINNLMIKGSRNYDLLVPLHARPVFCLGRDRYFLCSSDGEDACLRGVDDGGETVDGGVHAHVGDGEGSALVFFWLELSVSGALAEIFDLGGDGFETETFDVLYDGGHETDGGCDRDLELLVSKCG